MNTEEIKMLIELFSNVTDGAYSLLLIYIAKPYLSMLLGFSMGFFAIFQSIKFGKYLTEKFSFVSEIRTVMGFTGELIGPEKSRVLDILREYKK